MKKILLIAPILIASVLFCQNNNDSTFKISKYAYYEAEDANQRVVKPELIEKYRRARNNTTYVNLYPTDWDGIRKDQGLKLVSQKTKKTQARSKKQLHRNHQYASNRTHFYKPKSFFVSPFYAYGWNSRTSWNHNAGVMFGRRNSWLPIGTVSWTPRNSFQTGIMSPWNYYGNIYNQPFRGNYYQNNNCPHNNQQVTYQNNTPPQDAIVQIKNSNTVKVESAPVQNSANNDWSNGDGGPEKYLRNVKKISDYQIH